LWIGPPIITVCGTSRDLLIFNASANAIMTLCRTCSSGPPQHLGRNFENE
jgi:hypothetical protein